MTDKGRKSRSGSISGLLQQSQENSCATHFRIPILSVQSLMMICIRLLNWPKQERVHKVRELNTTNVEHQKYRRHIQDGNLCLKQSKVQREQCSDLSLILYALLSQAYHSCMTVTPNTIGLWRQFKI